MQKTVTTPTPDPWDQGIAAELDQPAETTETKPKKTKAAAKPAPQAQAPASLMAAQFDLEGLMTDFPTAKELERFVFDETGVVLNLKGRANKLKYQIAMDVLNGEAVDPVFIGSDNPYIDKGDLVPVDPIKDEPPRNSTLPDRESVQNLFVCNVVPHPDFGMRAQDKKVSTIFRKYTNGMISYQVLGPIEPQPAGEKIDKYGRSRPEVIKMIDPRTGEQVAVREDGTMTPQGKKLRAMMQTFRVNNSNQWDVWVDREFVSLDDTVANNPWDLK
jgi:hypothetical protein